MNINADLPLNTLSFGFCSYNILYELYRRKINPNLFSPQIDLGAYDKAEEDFKFYITSCTSKSKRYYSRKYPCFKLWHLNGSENSVSNQTSLMTFYELDSPTDVEINVLNNQHSVLVSSNETKKVFEEYGVRTPVTYCPLGFDSQNFFKTSKTYYPPEVVVFGIFGKFEKRKHHEKAIRAWCKRFAGDRRYVLHTHIYNPFFRPEDNQQILGRILEGRPKPFNMNVLPFMKTLSELNECLNAVNIVIDMSGGEGFSLPSFHCLGLGKHGIIHNCSAMKDWANKDNAVLVESSGKEEVYDGTFFTKGQPFNQGNIYTWDEDAFIAGCEEAIARHTANPVNEAGLKIQQDFTWSKTVDTILETLK